jgi:PAS domain S-box-containing protein
MNYLFIESKKEIANQLQEELKRVDEDFNFISISNRPGIDQVSAGFIPDIILICGLPDWIDFSELIYLIRRKHKTIPIVNIVAYELQEIMVDASVAQPFYSLSLTEISKVREIIDRLRTIEKPEYRGNQADLLAKLHNALSKVQNINSTEELLAFACHVVMDFTGAAGVGVGLILDSVLTYKRFVIKNSDTSGLEDIKPDCTGPDKFLKALMSCGADEQVRSDDPVSDGYLISSHPMFRKANGLISFPLVNRKSDLVGCLDIYFTEKMWVLSKEVLGAIKCFLRYISINCELLQYQFAEKNPIEPILQLSSILEAVMDAVLVIDRDGRIVLVNRVAERVFRLKSNSLDGLRFESFLTDEFKVKLQSQGIQQLIMSEPDVRYKLIARRSNGEEFHAEVSVSGINVSSEEYFVVILKDLSETILAQESARQLEAKYRSIFEHAIEGIYQATPSGQYFTVNPSLVKMLGYESADELMNELTNIGRQLYVDQGRRAELLRLLKEQGVVSNFESQVYRKDGSIIWISENARFVRNEKGEICYYEGTVENITDRKIKELEIQKLAAFPRLNPNPVLEISISGKINYYNDATLRLVNSFKCKDVKEILPADIDQRIKLVLQNNHPEIGLRVQIGKRTIQWDLFPVLDQQVVHCYAVEITDRLQLEESLRQSQKMESIGQLAAGVAHDFNNLLTVITGHSGLLLNDPTLPSSLKESVGQIAYAAERGAKLTRQLLAFSRRQRMEMKLLDLNEVVQSSHEFLKHLLGEHINLCILCDPRLPCINADSTMIEQIILNLSVNARDAMPRGGDLVIQTKSVYLDEAQTKKMAGIRPGTYACLIVSDTGCGMSEEVKARLFEPFFTTKEIGKGTGMGLATVYGIVKQHNGWIEVDSKINEGTVFRIYFPSTSGVVLKLDNQKQQTAIRGGTETILVVEDEQALRSLTGTILKRFGYDVILASNGVEALNIVQHLQKKIDLLLTDLVMPGGITGREVAEHLCAMLPGLKVIFISGYSVEMADPMLALSYGINFLQKPYSPAVLLKIVREVLDGKQKK